MTGVESASFNQPPKEQTMQMQLDRVVVPAGLFNPARTFSAVRADDGFYFIYTGKAMGNVPAAGGVSGAIAGTILDKMADKRLVEIAENERRLRESTPAEMAKTKHSVFVPKDGVEVDVRGGYFPIVKLKGGGKKLTLHFQHQDEATVRRFFASA
jgi:hypothetical protein